jgi:hypothetical protein
MDKQIEKLISKIKDIDEIVDVIEVIQQGNDLNLFVISKKYEFGLYDDISSVVVDFESQTDYTISYMLFTQQEYKDFTSCE